VWAGCLGHLLGDGPLDPTDTADRGEPCAHRQRCGLVSFDTQHVSLPLREPRRIRRDGEDLVRRARDVQGGDNGAHGRTPFGYLGRGGLVIGMTVTGEER
jgi:hypothetical protein